MLEVQNVIKSCTYIKKTFTQKEYMRQNCNIINVKLIKLLT